MTKLTKNLEAYADAFYAKNEELINESFASYQDLLNTLKIKFTTDNFSSRDFDRLIEIEDESIKDTIINIGYNFYDFKKAVRNKKVSEHIIQKLEMDVPFLTLCEQVNHYFEIKDRIININNLLHPIEAYKTGELDEEGKRKLYLRINSYQQNFNNHHLKKFSVRIFGISYKELIEIKESCYSQTYDSYASMIISKNGTTYIKKEDTSST